MNAKNQKRPRRNRRDARGSALLVSLMVIVGLSLLGLGFVAVSETERAIARNQQASLQTQTIAESGARLALEWFQNPGWALTNAALPSNIPANNTNIAKIKVTRVLQADPVAGTTAYSGVYKPDANTVLFDKPYRPGPDDRFYGDENTGDIVINRTTDASTIDKFNNILLGTGAGDKSQGEITEIRFYAPPMVNATLQINGAKLNPDGTPQKFWAGGQRFGVATIKVTASQLRDLSLTDSTTPKRTDPANILSQHSVRLIVGEVPVPIPAGPIQGNANASFGGAFSVHWGMETATGDLNVSRNGTAMPWANAYERPHFERGYEPGTAEVWPTQSGTPYDDVDYFHEFLGKSFGDPWYGARCGGDNSVDGSTGQNVNPQCYTYAQTSDEQSTGNPSWAFQWQDSNVYPFKKRVVFPVIKYDFWKKVTSQSRGYRGIYYFKYDSAGQGFRQDGTSALHPMAYWANTRNGAAYDAGVFFFDSAINANPQQLTGAARTAALTPGEKWKSSDFNGGMLMAGFVYMNAQSWGTTGAGQGPTTVDANFPGEPFRDVGYPMWDTVTKDWKDCSGAPCRAGAGDGVFSCDDINKNGRCDIVVMPSGAYQSHDPGAVNGPATWVVKTWKKAGYGGVPCTVPDAANYDGTNPAASDCSEPHEPFLNLIYPTSAGGSVTVGWEDPKKQTYLPKIRLNNAVRLYKGSPQPAAPSATPCPDKTVPLNCTSNFYDVDGPMVDLDVVLYGVLYNEGQYDAAGNAAYYGSVLIQDDIVKGNGTADVWFDEKLIKGSWSPPGMPRVMVFSELTDEEQ